MSKKNIGIIIITLIFIFPFRMVYLEYPETNIINGTVVDGGRIGYTLLFLSVVIGFLAFMFMSTNDTEH